MATVNGAKIFYLDNQENTVSKMALARKEVEFAQERDHKHLVKYYYYCENRILIKGDGT